MTSKWKNIPNLLSIFRLAAAPFLLCIAWFGKQNAFLVLFAISLATDAIDGFIARKLDMTSELGAKLDSLGDLAVDLTVPLCAWWLCPEIIKREAFFVLLAIGAFWLPILIVLIKFGEISSYHTWATKIQAVLMCSAIFLLFMADIAWPFRLTAITQIFVAGEEIAITLLLPELKSDVKSLWHVIKQR
jgi:CDP-diacylglycerol--glycerol-3-phosphate 3-phosphatidyltransferase